MITRQPVNDTKLADQPTTGPGSPPVPPGGKPLSDAARRALAEAEERRAEYAARLAELKSQEEVGRQGPEPVRYGDWENKGIASDF